MVDGILYDVLTHYRVTMQRPWRSLHSLSVVVVVVIVVERVDSDECFVYAEPPRPAGGGSHSVSKCCCFYTE